MNYKLKPLTGGKIKIEARLKVDGRDYRKRLTFTGSKRQAERKAAELVRELEEKAEAETFNSSLKTFGDCIQYYRERHGISEKDEYCFKRLESDLGKSPIEDMEESLDRFISFLAQSRTQKGTPYSPGTLNRFQQWTRAVLRYAEEWGVIQENPVKKLRKFKETPRDKSLTIEEREALIEAIQEHRPHLWAIVMYSLQIPCRVSELRYARRIDYDMTNNVIRIRNGKTKNGDGVTKPVPPNMVNYFRSVPLESEYLFYREERGEYKPLGDFKKAWKTVCSKAGIEGLRFHDLRHYAATELVHAGLSEREVMVVAGWKSNMLSTYYHQDGIGAAKAVFNLLSAQKEEKEPCILPLRSVEG